MDSFSSTVAYGTQCVEKIKQLQKADHKQNHDMLCAPTEVVLHLLNFQNTILLLLLFILLLSLWREIGVKQEKQETSKGA